MVELEVGEIEGKIFFIDPDYNKKYPHGVYQCVCKKNFHGHWYRSLHYASCPFRVPVSHVQETELQTWYCSLGHVEGLMKHTATCPACQGRLVPSILPPLIFYPIKIRSKS